MSHSEWYTPEKYINRARVLLPNIDLDPTSCRLANQVVQADRIMTKQDDCLSDDADWSGYVWMNPPYTRDCGGTGPYVQKCIQEWADKNVKGAVILVNASTSASWFEPLFEFPICFLSSRVRFDENINGKRVQGSSPRYANAIIWLPDSESPIKMMKEAYGDLGKCYWRHYNETETRNEFQSEDTKI